MALLRRARRHRFNFVERQKVWFRNPSWGCWWPGVIERPVSPDRQEFIVRVEGDPMRTRVTAGEDLLDWWEKS